MRILPLFLTADIVVTIVLGFTGVAVQQSLRQSANDPQIQAVESLVKATTTPKVEPIDISTSLGTFFIVVDKDLKPIAYSGMLDGKTPVPPAGVFDYVKTHGENRVTWEPKKGVRIAAVIMKMNGENTGYALVGRSLREVEKRETLLMQLCLAAWVASMVVLAIGYWFATKRKEHTAPSA